MDEDQTSPKRSRQYFQCPECRSLGRVSGSVVSYTRTNPEGARITRRRRCLADPAHTFTTEEALSRGKAEIWVRGSTNQKIHSRFSSSHLRKDIRRATMGRIDEVSLDRVVADVTAELEEIGTAVGTPLTQSETDQFHAGSYAYAVVDYVILEKVERRLDQRETQIAHILYALAKRGKTTFSSRPKGDSGFSDASDFLRWMFSSDSYAHLDRPIPAARQRRSENWLSPSLVAHPKTVIKRARHHQDFDFERFSKGIEETMRGRRPGWHADAQSLANWVLVQLEGQRKVSSAQLSSAAASALRRHDDIAYLRWAIVLKGMHFPADIADEAEDLLMNPSVALRFAHKERVGDDIRTPDDVDPDLAEQLRILADKLDRRDQPGVPH